MLSAPSVGCDAKAESPPPTRDDVVAELPALRVSVAAAERRALELDATATGRLHAFKSSTVAAEVPGRVVARKVERGQDVKRRDSLFTLDTTNSALALQQAKASEAASALDLEHAERELERGDALLSGQDIAQSSYDQLSHSRNAAKKRLELAGLSRRVASKSVADARTRAPFDGTVVRLHAEVGDYVGPGTPLATVADLSRLRLRVGLTATEADLVEQGRERPVRVSFSALGGRTVEASLHDIDPLMDPASGTYTAEFWIDQPDGAPLREGMVGRVVLDSDTKAPQVVVPRNSVVRHGGGFAVWVVQRGEQHRGVAERRPVTLGAHDATHTVVLHGLAEGDDVVTDGHFSLADGITVELDEAGA